MTFHYWVAYRTPSGLMGGDEVTVDRALDSVVGRIEAQKELAARGVPDPTITGWALRGTSGGDRP